MSLPINRTIIFASDNLSNWNLIRRLITVCPVVCRILAKEEVSDPSPVESTSGVFRKARFENVAHFLLEILAKRNLCRHRFTIYGL